MTAENALVLTLAAFPEDPDLVPSTHLVAYNNLYLQF